MSVEMVVSTLQLPPSVTSKANEILRKMDIKLPTGCSRQVDSSRHVLAVELACRLLRVVFDRSSLISIASVSENDYSKALLTVKGILNLQWQAVPVLEMLGIKYGNALVSSAIRVLEQYRKEYVDKLDLAVRANIDLSHSVYLASAFFVAAKAKKVKQFDTAYNIQYTTHK